MEINIKKDWKFWSILVISIIAITLFISYRIGLLNLDYIASYSPSVNEDKYNKTYELQKSGDEIEESFIAKYNRLSKIYVQFNELKIEKSYILTNGKATIGIKDENKNEIYSKEINVYDLLNSINYIFDFPEIKESQGNLYYLFIKCNEKYEGIEFFKVKYSEENLFENGDMYINGEKQSGDILFQEMYYNSDKMLISFAFIAIVILILSLIAIIIYYLKNIKEETLFWCIIPAIFILFLFIIPVTKNHDEPYHWFRILDIAQGNYLTQIKDDKPNIEMDENAWIIGNQEPEGVKYNFILNSIKNTKENGKDTINYEAYTTAIYNPVQYISQTLGVLITSLITQNYMLMAYGARFINMIVSIILLYLAIKIMPIGKRGMLISMCFPIAIEGFTSMSPDAITISISYLLIAYVFNLVFNKEKRIQKTDIFILAILSIIISLCKIVYLPLVGLLLLLPKDKFKTKKQWILTIGIIMGISIIANLIWLGISYKYLLLYKDGNSSGQLGNLIGNPINYIQRVLTTINVSAGSYIYSLLGCELGWNEFANVGTFFAFIMGVIIVYANLTDSTLKIKLTKYQKIILCLIVLAIVGLIFTSLYMQWNEAEDVIIRGVQGRYFIPILPILALLIFNKLKFEKEETDVNINKKSGIGICIIYMYVFANLIILNI